MRFKEQIRKNKTILIFVGVFVVVGSFILFITHAATPTASSEPENGTVTGATVVSDTSASGGKAIKFGTGSSSGIPTTTTSYLPINLPTQSWLKQGITSGSGKKLVFAHYFTPYPLRIANVAYTSDWYVQHYIYPYPSGADPSAATAYGGLLREAPLPQAVGASTWQLDDMKTEVTRATQAGLDGFTVDILSMPTTATQNWNRVKLLMQAASAVDPNFKIMLMPDASSLKAQTYQAVADAMATLASSPAAYHLADGRLVIAPFGPEIEGATYWANFITYMKSAHNISVAFVPCFINYGNNVAAFSSISYGLSEWGGRSPQVSNNIASNGNDAHSRGKIWMQPVSYQDERPNQHLYAEAQNGDNYRITWASAINTNAEWVQIPTWNDYSEEADIAPSTHHGWSLLDLTSYYLTKYKSSQNPPIVRDVAYVNHRIQLTSAAVTSETSPMTVRTDSNPGRNYIEVETFLTAPATVNVTIGSTSYSYSAPAGESSKPYPIAAGKISVTIVRNGATVSTIASPYNITTGSVGIQDLHYYYVSSIPSRNPPTGY